MSELVRHGHDVWIYTTSERSSLYIKLWFRAMGIRLGGVVNQTVHDRAVRRAGLTAGYPSKYPPAFGISLHVDDSYGVAVEGARYGYEVVVVSPEDPDWTIRVRQAVVRRAGAPSR